MNPYGWLIVAQTAAEATDETVRVMKMPSEMDVSGTMALLTWVTFIIATYLLYRIAWKPILTALDKREQTIKKSLDEAEKMQAQTAAAEEKRQQMLSNAETEAQRIVAEARQTAVVVSATLQDQARVEARTLIANAEREIQLATEKAVTQLRRESAALAVDLAGRLVRETVSPERKQQLVDVLLKEL